jgi:hypothetical protein
VQQGNIALNKFLTASPPKLNQKTNLIADELSPLDLNSFLQGGEFFEYSRRGAVTYAELLVLEFIYDNVVILIQC